MKPYPAYKPSGAQWLGDVPDSWSVLRVKEVATVLPSNIDKLTVDGELPVLLCNYVDVYKNDKITADIEFMPATASDEQIRKLALAKGDVALTKDSETPWDIAVPTYIAEDIPNLVCGYHLAKLAPNESLMRGDFLCWALKAFPVNVHFSLAASGITRYGLSIANISDGNIPVPSLTEQQTIVSYLDRETARIDTLITEKVRLTDTLREYRQTTISEVVTQGLDPAAPKKPSGVPWLGEVPRHWVIKKVKHVALMRSGEGITAEDIEDAGNYPVYGGNGCRGFTDCATHSGEFVLVGRQGALCGNVHHVRGEFWASEHAVVSSFYMGDSPRWAAYMFELMNLGQYSVSAAQPGLAVERILQLPLIAPPVSEQEAIADYLDRETARIDKLIAHVQDEIKLLQELRAATITDAVTGKIKVS